MNAKSFVLITYRSSSMGWFILLELPELAATNWQTDSVTASQ